jgi:hypothetical protein
LRAKKFVFWLFFGFAFPARTSVATAKRIYLLYCNIRSQPLYFIAISSTSKSVNQHIAAIYCDISDGHYSIM